MTTVTCPTCGRRFDAKTTRVMPFCGARCQQIDLGRWLDEEYGLPIEDEQWSDEETSLS